jgi:hypothetical protein
LIATLNRDAHEKDSQRIAAGLVRRHKPSALQYGLDRQGHEQGHPMKLSESILLGSTMMAAKSGGQYFFETKAGCALGMAAIANGCTFRRVAAPVNENERRTLGVEAVWGQWVLRVVRRPCACWALRVPRKMRIKDIIAHLFDFHVVEKKNWTLDQLACWVQTWEPKESNPAPIANVIPPRKPDFINESRSDQLQAEQEWQRVRQAFDARHKTTRSGAKISRWNCTDRGPSSAWNEPAAPRLP